MLCAVVCMELADFCRLSSAARTVASNSTIRASMREARSALAMPVLVLIGGERAGLDHAFAEHLQRIRHRRDLVVLVRAVDLRFEVAVGQQLHRALQAADPAQDVAADIEPDEQHRSDQGESAERQHHHGRKRNLAARLPGRGVGLALHAVDELLHADAEADIELAGLVEDGLAIIDGVEFLLAELEDAGLALAEREQFQCRIAQRLGRRRSSAADRGWT